MRVLAPINVSISAVLLCFGLNICITLGRNIAVRFGFHRHSLGLPDEGLAETMTGVSDAMNLYPDARGLKSTRQFYGFVVFLKVLEGVCQGDAVVRRDLCIRQTQRLALQESVNRDCCVAGDFFVRLSSLHQHELEVVLTRDCVRDDLHLLHFDMNQRLRLDQTTVKRQILIQARDLALHVAETSFDLSIALTVDPPRRLSGLQLTALSSVLRFERANARA